MIRVIELKVITLSAQALEVSISTALRELGDYDALDQPQRDVKLVTILNAGGYIGHPMFAIFEVGQLRVSVAT